MHAPGVRAAIFCDAEGERIDAACGAMTAFDVDVIGASFAALVQDLRCGEILRAVHDDATFWLIVVEQGCYLIVVCHRGLDFACKADLPSIARALTAYM